MTSSRPTGRPTARSSPCPSGAESSTRSERCSTRTRAGVRQLACACRPTAISSRSSTIPRRDSERGILTVVDRAGKKTVLTDEWARPGPILWSPTGDEVFFSRWGGRERRGVDLSGRTRSAAWIPGLDDVSRDGLFLDAGMLSENYRGVILRARSGRARRSATSPGSGAPSPPTSPATGRQLLLYEESREPDRPEQEVYHDVSARDGRLGRRDAGGGPRAGALARRGSGRSSSSGSPDTHLALLPTGAGEPKRLPGGGRLSVPASELLPGREADPVQRRRQGGRAALVRPGRGGRSAEADRPRPDRAGDARFAGRAQRRRQAARRWASSSTRRTGAERRADRRGALPADVPDPVELRRQDALRSGVPTEPTLTLYRLDLATGRRERWKSWRLRTGRGSCATARALRGVGSRVTPDGRYYAYTYLHRPEPARPHGGRAELVEVI